MVTNPKPDLVLRADDLVFVLAQKDQVMSMTNTFAFLRSAKAFKDRDQRTSCINSMLTEGGGAGAAASRLHSEQGAPAARLKPLQMPPASPVLAGVTTPRGMEGLELRLDLLEVSHRHLEEKQRAMGDKLLGKVPPLNTHPSW